MVGAPVDRPRLELVEVPGDAGMALRPDLLGQRLVGDLAHDIAAEPPAAHVANEQAGIGEVGERSGS